MSVSAPTLFDHVVPLEAGAHVTGAVWLKDVLALALGDGAVLLVGPETTPACRGPSRGRHSRGVRRWPPDRDGR